MAKKPSKKSAKKSGKKSSKKVTPKGVRKPAKNGPSKASAMKSTAKPSAGAKKSARKGGAGSSGSSLAPRVVKTGAGSSPAEVGSALIAACNRGDLQLNDTLWSAGMISIEGVGVGLAWHGRKAVDAKNAGWMAGHKIHGVSAEGPFIGSTGFAVRFRMDVEDLATHQRVMMDEVGVYTVKNGKIVQEEFMYGSSEPIKASAPA